MYLLIFLFIYLVLGGTWVFFIFLPTPQTPQNTIFINMARLPQFVESMGKLVDHILKQTIAFL